MTPILMQQFHASEATVSLFLGVTVITLGWANFYIIPFSNIFGRRAACLATSAVLIASNIWQATAKTTGSFFGARALNGLSGAVNESLMVQVITDVFFLHERGAWMGLYFTSYFAGTTLGPIISGNMAQYVGWRNFFWLCTGLACLNFLAILFLFPETKFHRSGLNGTGATEKIDTTGVADKTSGVEVIEASRLGSITGRGKPTISQWWLAQKPFPGAVSAVPRDIVLPIYLVSFPIIFWAAIVTGAAANTLLAMNLTQSPVFMAPPFLFTPGDVGFVNFAMFVGGLIGLATAGPVSDWFVKRMTVRNNHLREPEMRMLCIIPYFVVAVLGTIIIGVGYQRGWAWEAIVIFGYTCVGIQVVSLPTIAVAYAVDCYKPISGEILVLCTVMKNTFGFGMAWWIPEITPMQAVMALLACNIAACLCGVPVYLYGKRLRRFTRASKVHQMEALM